MQQASDFMRNSNLTQNTHNLFGNLGMIGQQDNATLLFFIFLTRFFKNPLHAIVMWSSGSGKTHLLQGVAGTVPKQHINVTNSRTGDSKQVYLHVEGPVCVAGATTRDKIYEDNANRSFLIQIEENPVHEREVMQYQGKVAAGLVNFRKYEENINLLKACQLLIEPMEVVIPFAQKLKLPQHVFKKMRTMNHYLTLVKAVTLWNQKQRKITTDQEGNRYLSATLEDVQWANYLCKDALLRKSDELGGKTRHFFESLKDLQTETQKGNPVFYAKDIRKYFRLHPMQLRRFLDELEARGFIKCKSRHMKIGNEYEITTWDDYRQLKGSIDALDSVLLKLREDAVKDVKML